METKDVLNPGQSGANVISDRKGITSLLEISTKVDEGDKPKMEITNEEKERREMLAERIGHELNNPLAAIISNIYSLKTHLSRKCRLNLMRIQPGKNKNAEIYQK